MFCSARVFGVESFELGNETFICSRMFGGVPGRPFTLHVITSQTFQPAFALQIKNVESTDAQS